MTAAPLSSSPTALHQQVYPALPYPVCKQIKAERLAELRAFHKLAQKALEEIGIADPRGLTPEEIVLGRGVFYNEKPLGGKEGEIVSYGDRSTISINSAIQYESKK